MEEEKSKTLIYAIITTSIIIIIIISILLYNPEKPEINLSCGDGSQFETCSLTKPYFCNNKELIEKASFCGCPDNTNQKIESCISEYQKTPEERALDYTLNGQTGTIYLTTYKAMSDYLSSLPQTISDKENITRADFKLRNINQEEQKQLLLPLVIKIQNLEDNKQDQARIAISIIQNIPYGTTNKFIDIGGIKINYSRYPYEVLTDNQGICGEKAELLAFLLKEIGYETILFYYSQENHEAVGIKCPLEQSLNNTGYCFIETTGPSIITNNQNKYAQAVKLSSQPEIIFISKGETFNAQEEYQDTQDYLKIINIIEQKGQITSLQSDKLNYLRKKYGLTNYILQG